MNDVLGFLGIAFRAGKLAAGDEQVADALDAHKTRLILIASDASQKTCRRIESEAEGLRVFIMRLKCDKSELGGALGRAECAVCAVTDAGISASVASKIASESGNENDITAAERLALARKRQAERRSAGKKDNDNANRAKGKHGKGRIV